MRSTGPELNKPRTLSQWQSPINFSIKENLVWMSATYPLVSKNILDLIIKKKKKEYIRLIVSFRANLIEKGACSINLLPLVVISGQIKVWWLFLFFIFNIL